MSAFVALLRRDLQLGLRAGGGVGLGVAFFIMAASLTPFGIGPEPNLLGRVAGGVIQVSALLACLLSLDRLFQADHEDGSLDQLLLSPLGAELMVLAKVLAHWLLSGLPLVLAAPIIAIMLNLPLHALPVLLLALLIGTPALSAIGAIGAALTVGIRRGGLLLSLLVLPLYVPTLIFGATAVEAAVTGVATLPHLALLGAISLGAMALSPFAAAAALRLNIA